MTKAILIFLALAAGVVALMLLQPGGAKPPGIGYPLSGKFVVTQNGASLIEEEYTVAFKSGQGYVLVAQATTSQGGMLLQHYQLRPDFSFSLYQLWEDYQTASRAISVEPHGKGLRLEVKPGGGRGPIDIPDRRGVFILDNNLTAQYQLLISAVKAGKLGREFEALVPQAGVVVPARIAGPKRATFTSGEDSYSGEAYTLKLGDLSLTVLVYRGRVVGLLNPAHGIAAYEATLFPQGITYKAPSASSASPAGAAQPVEKEVTFPSGKITLAGTLTLPPGPGPFPAVLLLGGSGPVDRNENAPGLKSDVMRQIAAALARAGVASLRYDKRGVGKSGGDFKAATLTDFVSDARAALSFLRSRPEIDPQRLFILGHSEGGVIGPLVAAGDPTVAGLILLAAPAHSLDYIIRHQVEELNRAAGKSEDEVQAALAREDQFLDFVRHSHGNWSDYSFPELKQALPWITKGMLPQITALPLAWLREHFQHDPLATIAEVKCPVLIIQGKKDFQVPPEEAQLLAQALKEAGNGDVTVKLLPDLNHLLRHHPEEPNIAYRHLDEPVDRRVLEAIIAWLSAHGAG